MSRGGKRSGTPGKTYANRSDLNTPTGQIYGDKVAMKERMDAVPIQPAPTPTPAPVSAPIVPPPPLDRPTERPMEPITAGLPTGAGPGPEALWMTGPNLEKIRPFLPVLELIASRPDAGTDARNLVRRLRGALG